MKRLLTICALIGMILMVSVTLGVPKGKGPQKTVWHVPGDFDTIQEAINSPDVSDGHTILVGPGSHAGATVTKPVEIKGEGGAVINSGPVLYPGDPFGDLAAGFYFPSSGAGAGAIISHLRFEIVEFPIMSSSTDNVTINHCTLANPLQGISNWMGSGWQISHNVITDLRSANGGGIGIFIGDYKAIEGGITGNVVSHNKITGTLHVWENDGGGYSGSGIEIYADFRWEGAGAEAIKNNRVVKNKVSLVSDTPTVVDVVAIGLTDTRDDPELDPVVFDNAIGFNDFRGTESQIALTPVELDNPVNKISRNLGNNRGDKLYPPSAFGPGGN